ncbi:MAG: hypothetical protein ACRDV9_04405, partial [Acidimicrobiia bacterium]
MLLGLQRSAGNRAVAGLLAQPPPVVQRAACSCGGGRGGCGSGEEAGDALVQRALTRDLQVRGKFERAAKHPSQVFFDFDSSLLDAEEAGKIEAFRKTSPPPAVLSARASEEGERGVNETAARRRGEVVADRLASAGVRPRVEVKIDDAADVPDYRFMRRVDMGVLKASEDRCALDPKCEGELVTAIGAAKVLAGRGRSAAANAQPPIRVALQDVFHASDDKTATKVAEGFGAIDKELDHLAQPGSHECRTPCTDSTCRAGTRAFLDVGANLMVGCPDLKKPPNGERDKIAEETVLHEAVHGAEGILGSDFARLFEPLFPFLTREAALA